MDRAAKLKGCQFDVIFQGANWGQLKYLVTQATHKIFLFVKEKSKTTLKIATDHYYLLACFPLNPRVQLRVRVRGSTF